MDGFFNSLSQTPANEFTLEDLEMVNAFFESSKFKGQELHRQYVERCQPKSHSISARTNALRSLLEPQQSQSANNMVGACSDSCDLKQPTLSTPDTSTPLPRKRTIKRKRRSLRLTIEKMKRSLLKQQLAKQVHKQNLRSTETIIANALGQAPQTIMQAVDDTPGVHVLPKGLQTEEYETWCKAAEDLVKLAEPDKGPVRYFSGQTVLLLMKFPILLSPRIKAKLRVTGGLLVFNKNNAAVFCTIFDTPLEFRKFTTTLSKLCGSEYHQYMILFAGNRYLSSKSFNNRLEFVTIQQKSLEEQIICTILQLDSSSNANRAAATSIEKTIRFALDDH